MFIKRKAASFLYTNTANVRYDRFVTDRVISGEYPDYPSACAEGSLEYFCDSYRREHHVVHGAVSGSRGNSKPWSGYPYPYCFFWNEMPSCSKKSCNLKHECGYCFTSDHKSKDCSKSLWKKVGENIDRSQSKPEI